MRDLVLRPSPRFLGVEQLPVRTPFSEVLNLSVGNQVGAPAEILLLPHVEAVNVRVVSAQEGGSSFHRVAGKGREVMGARNGPPSVKQVLYPLHVLNLPLVEEGILVRREPSRRTDPAGGLLVMRRHTWGIASLSREKRSHVNTYKQIGQLG